MAKYEHWVNASYEHAFGASFAKGTVQHQNLSIYVEQFCARTEENFLTNI